MEVLSAGGAFKIPRKSTRLVRTTPPLVHITPYLCGGLQQLYENIRAGAQDWLHDCGQFTDEDGVFRPRIGMPLLAGRYKFQDLLGKGQSSVLIKAQDTFCANSVVSIKVLHTHYNVLGAQEMDCIRKLNQADPEGLSPTVQLKTVFTLDDHYCMVFELLSPRSLLTHFKAITQPAKKMSSIRKVVLQLLQALGFFQQQNVIHADLKPENILLQNDGDFSRLKVVDLGNALHCVHDELSLYYDDFELQTLLYRAPEVMFGVPFGMEVDMWSLGCIVAELYTGQALFFGTAKQNILTKMVNTLGPLPSNIFQRGKFFDSLKSFTDLNCRRDRSEASLVLMKVLETTDYAFADFLLGLLQYDPAKRMSVAEAAQHAFLAPELGLRYLMPPTEHQGKPEGYQRMILTQKSYDHSPAINSDISKQHLSSVGLLRQGTLSKVISKPSPRKPTPKKVAEILPFVRNEPVDDLEGQRTKTTFLRTNNADNQAAFSFGRNGSGPTDIPGQVSDSRDSGRGKKVTGHGKTSEQVCILELSERWSDHKNNVAHLKNHREIIKCELVKKVGTTVSSTVELSEQPDIGEKGRENSKHASTRKAAGLDCRPSRSCKVSQNYTKNISSGSNGSEGTDSQDWLSEQLKCRSKVACKKRIFVESCSSSDGSSSEEKASTLRTIKREPKIRKGNPQMKAEREDDSKQQVVKSKDKVQSVPRKEMPQSKVKGRIVPRKNIPESKVKGRIVPRKNIPESKVKGRIVLSKRLIRACRSASAEAPDNNNISHKRVKLQEKTDDPPISTQKQPVFDSTQKSNSRHTSGGETSPVDSSVYDWLDEDVSDSSDSLELSGPESESRTPVRRGGSQKPSGKVASRQHATPLNISSDEVELL